MPSEVISALPGATLLLTCGCRDPPAPPSRYLDRVKQLVDEARLETKSDQVDLLCHSGEACCGLSLYRRCLLPAALCGALKPAVPPHYLLCFCDC